MEEQLTESQVRVLMVLEENEGITYEELAELAGLSYDGVRGRVSELTKMGFNIQRIKDGRNTVLHYEKEEKPKRRGKLNKPRTYGDLVQARMKSLEDFYGMTDFLNELRDIKPKTRKKKKNRNVDKCGVLLLSDLHFGQIIKENGDNVYDTETAEIRMEDITNQVTDELLAKNIDSLYIALLGDIIDGDTIYKNHLFQIEKAAIDQVKDATKSLAKMIKSFNSAGISVEAGCVRGNHGITNYKNLEQDNWDNVVYDMLKLIFDGEENVEIIHYDTNEAKVNILDRCAVLTHGDSLGDQIRTASGSKTFRGLCNKHNLQQGDMVFTGHLHFFGIETDQDRILVRNGSLSDTSEYALGLNYFNWPMQTLLILQEDFSYPRIIPLEV